MTKWGNKSDLGYAAILLAGVIAADSALSGHIEPETLEALALTTIALGSVMIIKAHYLRELTFWLWMGAFALLHGGILAIINIPEVFDRPTALWTPFVILDGTLMANAIDRAMGRRMKPAGNSENGIGGPSKAVDSR